MNSASSVRPSLTRRCVRPLLISALAAALLVTETGCGAQDAQSRATSGRSTPARAVLSAPGAEPATAAAAPVQDGVAPVARPQWLPAGVPFPDSAQLTSVDDERCAVTWVLSGADLQATGAELVARSEAAGLAAALTATSEHAQPSAEELALLTDAEAVQVVPDVVRTLGLRIRGEAPGADSNAAAADVQVEVQMTAVAGGVVIGEHRSSGGECSR